MAKAHGAGAKKDVHGPPSSVDPFLPGELSNLPGIDTVIKLIRKDKNQIMEVPPLGRRDEYLWHAKARDGMTTKAVERVAIARRDPGVAAKPCKEPIADFMTGRPDFTIVHD